MALTFEVLKQASLILLPFSLYFVWLKLGHKVAASYSWRVSRLTASGIGSVTLINMKDRPVPIFSVHAVMDGIVFGLREFDPPMILKPFEAIMVEANVVSEWFVGSEEYDWRPPIETADKVEIYLCSSFKTIKCKPGGYASKIEFATKKNLAVAAASTRRFNEIIYNDNALFALTYVMGGETKTAIIDNAGFIGWDILPNMLRKEDIRNADAVRQAIISSGLERIIGRFFVDDLQERRLRGKIEDE